MTKSLKDDEAEKLNDSIVNKSDSVKLDQIIHKTELLLSNIGIRVNSEYIIFEIVDQKALNRLKPEMRDVVGLTCPIYVEGKFHKIWLLENRTYIHLMAVVAHEMGHTWCRDQRINLSQIEEEGLCEFIAYYVLSTQLSKLGNAWKELMLINPDPVYGDGLRLMIKKFEICKRSWPKFLAFIKLCGR